MPCDYKHYILSSGRFYLTPSSRPPWPLFVLLQILNNDIFLSAVLIVDFRQKKVKYAYTVKLTCFSFLFTLLSRLSLPFRPLVKYKHYFFFRHQRVSHFLGRVFSPWSVSGAEQIFLSQASGPLARSAALPGAPISCLSPSANIRDRQTAAPEYLSFPLSLCPSFPLSLCPSACLHSFLISIHSWFSLLIF